MIRRIASIGKYAILVSVVVLYAGIGVLSEDGHFTNDWAVHIPGGESQARLVAEQHGYEYIGRVGDFPDYFVFSHRDTPTRSKRSAHTVTKRLEEDHRVHWVEQQVVKQRVKRDLVQKDVARFNDEFWPNQWYLQDTRDSTDKPKLDLHVIPVWDKGITGHGVTVSVLDDGFEWTHEDLNANYDSYACWDYNDNDPDPFPKYTNVYAEGNKHGTRCIGEIGMVADNGLCGVGVAYKANIGGIRMLDGKVTDVVEGSSLSHNLSHIDIYSASWGPNDDGKTVEGPGILATNAFKKGITEGRNGKGAIYVWASGNGGGSEDNCDCDGYTDSIYTVSVSSASEYGQSPWYAERCSSTLATTLSSGGSKEKKIVSADLHNGCTTSHTGTSASAPLAAGVIALLLEANNNVTWRDVQHIIVWTSEPEPLEKAAEMTFKTNGVGLKVDESFGFGILNAQAMIEIADPAKWVSVPDSKECIITSENTNSRKRKIPVGDSITISIDGKRCKEDTMTDVRYLEHVKMVVSITHPVRGELMMYLESPSGTKTMLLSERSEDRSKEGFDKWAFMSVHTWGENPQGEWTLTIVDLQKGGQLSPGTLQEWKLELLGTTEKPNHQPEGGRVYGSYNEVKDNRQAKIPIPSTTIYENVKTNEDSNYSFDDSISEKDDDFTDSDSGYVDETEAPETFLKTYEMLKELEEEAALKQMYQAQILKYLFGKGDDYDDYKK